MRRKTSKNSTQAKPSERFPLNIQQSLYVVSSIISRLAAKELDVSEKPAATDTAPNPTEVQNDN